MIMIKEAPAEFYFQENCYITELHNASDDPELSVARVRVNPGETTRWHRLHGITERYHILSGKGRVEVGDLAPADVCAGDTVLIPPMCRQRITNTGIEELLFLAICTPRFVESAYQDIEA
jgi:mannose-6-phosphate isomerase-like protein (cupin superfamily)